MDNDENHQCNVMHVLQFLYMGACLIVDICICNQMHMQLTECAKCCRGSETLPHQRRFLTSAMLPVAMSGSARVSYNTLCRDTSDGRPARRNMLPVASVLPATGRPFALATGSQFRSSVKI